MIEDLRLFIARGKCPPLFGRDWIQAFYGKDWAEQLTQKVNAVDDSGKPEKLQATLNKYAATIFKPGLVELKEITANLKLKPNAQTKFCKPRTVPYAVKPKLEEALERMVAESNLEKVDHCE